jgi:hypothetical protein
MTERHLTDMELSVLACAAGSDALRAALAEHLGTCDSCLERLQACLKVLHESADATGTAADPDRAQMPEETRRKLADAFTKSRQGRDRPFPMDLLIWGVPLDRPLTSTGSSATDETVAAEEIMAWAAQGPRSRAAGERPAVSFGSGRSEILLRLRQPSPDAVLEGQLTANEGVITGRVSLMIPSRELSFDVDAMGVVKLPGIDPAEISTKPHYVALRFSDELRDAGTGETN